MSGLFTCSISNCDQMCVPTTVACQQCSRHLCDVHQSPPFHTCISEPLDDVDDDDYDDDAEYAAKMNAKVQRIRDAINEAELRKRASSLNHGRDCEIEHPPAWGAGSLMGCANYHARIRFLDGSATWLVRIARSGIPAGGSLPHELVDELIASEYATLKFLATTSVPAPKPFGYGLCSDPENTVGVGYILMEEMPGKVWNGQGSRASGKTSADDADKKRVWEGLADILIELHRHPFPRAGSLRLREDSDSHPQFDVGATASDRFLLIGIHGPYETEEAYYHGFVEQYLNLIATHQVFTEFPVNAYLIFMFLKSNIASVCTGTNKFFLKHVDDKGDHLMVDEDLKITGVIDWQMARVVPPSEAFGPSLVTADMGDLDDGRSRISVSDKALSDALRAKGANELADIMAKNEKLRRFFFVDVDSDWDEMLLLVKGMWTAFGVPDGTEWAEWKEQALRKREDDGRLKSLKEYATTN
ncbi:hypothetical protein EDC01DRAFT_679839, partial [Geopyxis carbonaria]